MAKRKTLQQLFDLAIDSGEYRKAGYFMCIAMDRLLRKGQITEEEDRRAHLSIERHLAKSKRAGATMRFSLIDKGILHKDDPAYSVLQFRTALTTEIYRNWSRRDALLYWQTRAMQLKLEHGFIEAKGVE